MDTKKLSQLAFQYKQAAQEKCHHCKGTGEDPETGGSCFECGGAGVMEGSSDIMEEPLLMFLREQRRRPRIEHHPKKMAAKKSKEEGKKKLDPKAKVRNRGEVVFPAESSKVSDDKDHFKINDIGEARSALSRSHQYDKAPPWFKGTLKELQETVRRKVHKKFPGIEISKDKKSSK